MKALIASLLLFGVLSIAPVSQVQSVQAADGHSCTGWRSRTVEPDYIRVLNTRNHRVYKVRFKRYVAQVMASGEWSSHMPSAVLYAGAQATKQYGWYYALRGHWRGGKSSGHCYDVVNTTNDQLWGPKAKPTSRQITAVEAVWGLSLWKWGEKFFLTGYRAGTTRGCAQDVDGWKLYARSALSCARKGWSGERILRTYFSRTTHRWAGE